MGTVSGLPCLERVGESLIAGGAFFDGYDGSAVVAVDDRNIEPATLLQQLKIAILVGRLVGQADQVKVRSDLAVLKPGEWHTDASISASSGCRERWKCAPAGKLAGSLKMTSEV